MNDTPPAERNETPQIEGVHLSLAAAPSGADGELSVKRIDELARLADELPVDRVSVGDHQGNQLECYTAVGFLAARTSRVRVGPCVTNAVAREPGIHAAALASLDAMSGGRAFLVLGRGDGAVRNLGLAPHTPDQARDALVAIRKLLREGAATVDGRVVRMRWPQDTTSRIPLALAGAGPAMLRFAGEVADEVYVSAGVTPEHVISARAAVGAAASGARREPPLMWWVATPFAVTDRPGDALAAVGESLATIANHSLRGADYTQHQIPAELWPAFREFHARYDWTRKNVPGQGQRNADLLPKLGLDEYLLERYAVAGSPTEIIHRLRQLAARGVRHIMLRVNTREELEALAHDILPVVRTHDRSATHTASKGDRACP